MSLEGGREGGRVKVHLFPGKGGLINYMHARLTIDCSWNGMEWGGDGG